MSSNKENRTASSNYRKPPGEHQFKKGTSGNTKGRPRKKKAVQPGARESRKRQVLARWARRTAWPPWPWTKRGDRSRFEKATRSQRYLRCRPYFERCTELRRRETPRRDANFWS